MQVESKRRNKKLDGISHGKTVRRTTPLKASQPSNAAKVRKDIEPTKEKLRNLADRWKGVNKVRGFLTELWKALGIDMTNNSQQNGGNPSRYAAFQLQDGTTLTVTIRASAHNANASTYIKDGNINGDTNISIVLQNRRKKNTFVPHDDVQLSEYVYVEDRIATVDSPLSQIAMSLVGYLTNGKYVDTTGVAIPHTSPQTNDNNILNCNLNMNKKVIRLTESDLHRIVKESVNKVIKEGLWDGIEQNGYQIHDQFVDFIKDYYAKGDNQLAYQIEDDVNGWLAKMMEDLDNKYGSTMA